MKPYQIPTRSQPAVEPHRYPERPEDVNPSSSLGIQWAYLTASEETVQGPGYGHEELERLGALAAASHETINRAEAAGLERSDNLLLGELLARRRLELVAPRLSHLEQLRQERRERDFANNQQLRLQWRDEWAAYVELRGRLFEEARRARRLERREPDAIEDFWASYHQLRERIERQVGSVSWYPDRPLEVENV